VANHALYIADIIFHAHPSLNAIERWEETMTIATILRGKGSQVFTLDPSDSMRSAANALTERKVGALVVTDKDGGVAGILSERDVVRVVALHGGAALDQLVSAVMTRDVFVAKLSDTVDQALARMTDRRIRHLPVVDKGKLVGVVSIGDLVKRRIDEALAEADAMRSYIATG
jgi:CBS domain-containing protein